MEKFLVEVKKGVFLNPGCIESIIVNDTTATIVTISGSSHIVSSEETQLFLPQAQTKKPKDKAEKPE